MDGKLIGCGDSTDCLVGFFVSLTTDAHDLSPRDVLLKLPTDSSASGRRGSSFFVGKRWLSCESYFGGVVRWCLL